MTIAASLVLRPCGDAVTFALSERVPQSSGGGDGIDGMREQIASPMRLGAMGAAAADGLLRLSV